MSAQQLSDNKPVLEQVYEILEGNKSPKTFYELADQIIDTKMDKEARGELLARLYTNINLDGRFLSVGDNFWGLKSWYPLEQREEDVAMTLAPKRKKKTKKEDDFDDYDEDLEDYDELDLEDDLDEEEDLDEDIEEEDDEFDKPAPVTDLDEFSDDEDVEEEPIGDTIIDLEEEEEED